MRCVLTTPARNNQKYHLRDNDHTCVIAFGNMRYDYHAMHRDEERMARYMTVIKAMRTGLLILFCLPALRHAGYSGINARLPLLPPVNLNTIIRRLRCWYTYDIERGVLLTCPVSASGHNMV